MQPQSFSSRLVAIFAGELVSRGCVVAAFVWIARTLDPGTYGEVEWALSLTMVFSLFADAGLSTWALAQIAARPDRAPTLVAQVGRLRLKLAVPTYALLLATAWTRAGAPGSALAIYGLVLFLSPLSLQYLFDGLLQTRWTAGGSVVRGATFLASVLLLVDRGSRPSAVAFAEVLAALALAMCHLLVLRRVFRLPVRIRHGGHDSFALLARSWRIGASDVAWGVHAYAGLIFLGYASTPPETAWHSASLRLLLALHAGVWLYLSTLLPTLARLSHDNPQAWRRVVEQSLRITGWAGCGAALVGVIGADTILTTVFGPPFTAAVPAFRAMIWVVPVSWMGGHIRYSLIAAQHPEREYRARLVGTATTIVLTLIFVPVYRSAGAAGALLGGTIANAVAAWAHARSVLPDCAYGSSLAPSSLCCLGCVAVGILLTPTIGEQPATVISSALFVAAALVLERERAPDLVRALAGALGQA